MSRTRAKDRLLSAYVAKPGRRRTGGRARFLQEVGLYAGCAALPA